MKKTNDYTLHLMAFIFGIAALTSYPGCYAPDAYSAPVKHQYINGEILTPDYAHTDTLIVTDADYLNSYKDSTNTDAEIFEMLNEGCTPYPHACNWIFCDMDCIEGLPNFHNAVDSLHYLHPDLSYIEIIKLQISQQKTAHACNWPDCEQQGKTAFVSHWGYKDGSAGYAVEITHFANPSWDYSQCEDYAEEATGNLNFKK